MRISADIIDDETIAVASTVDKGAPAQTDREKNSCKPPVLNVPPALRIQAEAKVRKYDLKREHLHANPKSFKINCYEAIIAEQRKRRNIYQSRSGYSSVCDKEKRNELQLPKHYKTVPIVERPRCSNTSLFKGFNEMHSKFMNMKINDSLKTNIKHCCDYAKASCSTQRHKMDEIKANSDKSSREIGTPPPWMVEFLHKMKQEIKEEVLEELSSTSQATSPPSTSQNAQSNISGEEQVIHHNVYCDNCDQVIKGIRYKCGNCSDYDLCQECESFPNVHNKNHIFLKIRYPTCVRLFQTRRGKSVIIPDAEHFTPKNVKIRIHPHKRMLDATFVCDETVPDLTVVAPSVQFVKSWRVLNSGGKAWSHTTKLKLVGGSPSFIPVSNFVDVPHLKPGQEGTVSVILTSPANPGVYKSCWCFYHKDKSFGDLIWCQVTVKEYMQQEEQEGNSSIQILSIPDDEIKQDVASITQILTSVKEEHERGNTIPRKLAVNSHTATPNNTPFDLSPPKSPDHQAHNEMREVSETRDSESSNNQQTDYDDDEVSIVSLSSSESDGEFVVIPMPKCFNLSDSFTSQHISQLSQYLPPETVANLKEMTTSESKITPQNTVIRPTTFGTERVSQETGVPELATSTKEPEQQILISHSISADGSSSSEVSVIESCANSPTEETGVSEIHISVENYPDASHEPKNVPPEKGVTKESNANSPPSSITFPKFPIEGITSNYEPVIADTEQKNVHVLPEKLVTTPLSAAAMLYRTARNVISSFQQPEAAASTERSTRDSPPLSPMDLLTEMGFCNRQQNEELLRKHKNNVAEVVAELLNMNDNDWYASRHNPPSPPDFFD